MRLLPIVAFASLLAAAAWPGLARAESHCARVLRTIRALADAEGRPAPRNLARLARNHFLFPGAHGYESSFQVLVPGADGALEVREVGSAEEAYALLREIDGVVDFGRMVEGADAKAQGIVERLAAVLAVAPEARLSWRVKTFVSLKRKVFARALESESAGGRFSIDDVTDLVGTRFTVPSPASLEVVRDALVAAVPDEEILEVEEVSKASGYHAWHLNGRLASGLRYQVQIMTERMATWANWEHDRIYKPERPLPEGYRARLEAYAREALAAAVALDEGREGGPEPDPSGILAEDRFPWAEMVEGAGPAEARPLSMEDDD